MKAVITVTAKDAKGIIAKVSGKVFEYGANIVDISQSVLKEYFAMIMIVASHFSQRGNWAWLNIDGPLTFNHF